MTEKKKTRIIFICYGNVCRSTMSEFVMKNIVRNEGRQDAFIIESAGTGTETAGMDIHAGTKKKLEEYAIPYDSRAARRLSPEQYEEADYLIGMDRKNVEEIKQICGGDPEGKVYKLLDFAGEDRDISDPYYTHNFDNTYDDVICGCKALAEKVLK